MGLRRGVETASIPPRPLAAGSRAGNEFSEQVKVFLDHSSQEQKNSFMRSSVVNEKLGEGDGKHRGSGASMMMGYWPAISSDFLFFFFLFSLMKHALRRLEYTTEK